VRIRNQKDFWSAVMFVIFGVMFIVWSSEYQFGNTQRMGPGYFPTILGILLVLLGILVALPALKADAEETHVGKIGWRGLIVILGSVTLYAVLLPRLGFVIAMASLVIISAMASKEFTWKAALLSVIFLGGFSYIVFVKGLELQFPVWPIFLTR
jgi:drug/metabolite transporter (DMT)-like permease